MSEHDVDFARQIGHVVGTLDEMKTSLRQIETRLAENGAVARNADSGIAGLNSQMTTYSTAAADRERRIRKLETSHARGLGAMAALGAVVTALGLDRLAKVFH